MSENDLTTQQEVINKATAGVERSIYIQGRLGYKISGYVSVHQGATEQDITELMMLQVEATQQLLDAVNERAEALLQEVTEANGLVDNRPQANSGSKDAPTAGLAASYHERSTSRQAPSQQPKRDKNGGWYTTEVIDGREFEVRHYLNDQGEECVSVPAVQEGKRATYKPTRNAKTGQEYTALQNMMSDIRFNNGPNTWEARVRR